MIELIKKYFKTFKSSKKYINGSTVFHLGFFKKVLMVVHCDPEVPLEWQ